MDIFLWDPTTNSKNTPSEKYESLHPFLFLSFVEFSRAEVVLDIGANVGLYSLISTLSSQVKSIYAFEPNKASHSILKKNLFLNSLNTKIQALQLTVSNTNLPLRLRSSTTKSNSHLPKSSSHRSPFLLKTPAVPTIRLDDLQKLEEKVLALKIGALGYESQIIEGAQQLLLSNPTIIQTQSNVDNAIDKKLKELGYFCFFSVGQTHFFTNISNFSEPLFIKRALEYACSWFNAAHTGQWPTTNTITCSLSVKHKVTDEKIHVQAILKEGFFTEPEFAFYLLVDKNKVEEHWYKAATDVVFDYPIKVQLIQIQAFVREKKSPEKKISITHTIKPITEVKSTPSAYDSLGLPSQLTSLINNQSHLKRNHYKIDFSPLLQQLKTEDSPSHLILIGLKRDELPEINLLDTNIQIHQANNLSLSPSVQISIDDDSKCAVILMAQAISDLKASLPALEYTFQKLPQQSTLYAEALTNLSYKEKITDLAMHYNILITWLYPKSDILIPKNDHILLSDKAALNERCESAEALRQNTCLAENAVLNADFDFALMESQERG